MVCFPWPGNVVTLLRITIGKKKSEVQCCEFVAANTSTGKQTRSAIFPHMAKSSHCVTKNIESDLEDYFETFCMNLMFSEVISLSSISCDC